MPFLRPTLYLLPLLLLGVVLPLAAQAPSAASGWSLPQCISYALEHNLSLKQRQLDTQSSKLTLLGAKLAFLPSLSASASHGYSAGRTIDPFSNQFVQQSFQSSNGGVSASMNLFNGLRNQHQLKKQVLELQAAQLGLAADQNTVVLNVMLSYLEILKQNALLEVAQRQVVLSQTQLQQTTKLVKAGRQLEQAALEVEAQLAADELSLLSTRNTLENARLALRQLLNLPDSLALSPDSLPLTVPRAYPTSREEVYQQALQNQPLVAGADVRISSARQDIRIARASTFPSLSLSGYLGTTYSAAAGDRFIPDGTSTQLESASPSSYVLVNGMRQPVVDIATVPNGSYIPFTFADQLRFNLQQSLSLSLSIPVFQGWQTRLQISNARLAEQKAEYAAQETRQQLRKTINEAYQNMTTAEGQYQVAQKQVEALSKAFGTTQTRFNAGAIEFTAYQLARNNWNKAQSELVQAQYNYLFTLQILDFYQNPAAFTYP